MSHALSESRRANETTLEEKKADCFTGQGMNASMHDSHNIGMILFCSWQGILMDFVKTAWKLAQVLRGRAEISLLKTVCSRITRAYLQGLITSPSMSSSARNMLKISSISIANSLLYFRANRGHQIMRKVSPMNSS